MSSNWTILGVRGNTPAKNVEIKVLKKLFLCFGGNCR